MQIVLDTNVLVSGFLSATGPPGRIVEAALAGHVQLVFDIAIRREYEDVLRRRELALPPGRVDDLFATIDEFGHRVAVVPSWPTELPDPNDGMFLAVAAATENVLVTGNTRHFSTTLPWRGRRSHAAAVHRPPQPSPLKVSHEPPDVTRVAFPHSRRGGSFTGRPRVGDSSPVRHRPGIRPGSPQDLGVDSRRARCGSGRTARHPARQRAQPPGQPWSPPPERNGATHRVAPASSVPFTSLWRSETARAGPTGSCRSPGAGATGRPCSRGTARGSAASSMCCANLSTAPTPRAR